MRTNHENTVVKKVYAYILKQYGSEWQLLVFKHRDFPEAGIQVPGGTVEPGESISGAILREVREETGLDCVALVGELGVSFHDMSSFGLEGFHERHYFQFRVSESTKDSWIAYEETPSDGSPGPIAFKFYWINLESVPPLAGRTDEMLPKLIERLKDETG